MEILALENLTFSYPQSTRRVLDTVSFSIKEGEFCVMCGATGSGKSTLLRLCKPSLAPTGQLDGQILFKGTPLDRLSSRDAAMKIGFVCQQPDQQIVCDKVWHELAFGLENLGLPQKEIALRVAEMASYLGIEPWYDKPVSALSGGQKQLLCLASVMVMHPDVLILDEPTSQLDPIAAAEFIHTLKKLNRDFSLTVLIAEHRLEELVPICDRLIVLEKGGLLGSDAPLSLMPSIAQRPQLLASMPSAVRIACALGQKRYPLSVRQGREMLAELPAPRVRALPEQTALHGQSKALQLTDVHFRYARELPDVLSSLSLSLYEGETLCMLGGNGSGKSTLLAVAAGIFKPYAGKIEVLGKKIGQYKGQALYDQCLSLLPQDVQTVFLCNTVHEELADAKVDHSALPFDLSHLLNTHPYDLSGGEQQLVALAKALATKPRVLLMDEPTKGLDAEKKAQLIEILRALKADGVSILIVTHDVEFAALCADRCVLLFRGQAVSDALPRAFFAENNFYTTAARRLSRGFLDNAVTTQDVSALYGKEGTP
ncbi:MAG: ATP-binding cassette domain-containing protein [Ruminococcaceae bacterium]|nr:ATP-binding cassette domain-containing protein [Oscillospiraceae bacterium]